VGGNTIPHLKCNSNFPRHCEERSNRDHKYIVGWEANATF